jgi:uncharacterized protein involved in response to NO
MAQPRIVDAGRWASPGLALLSYGFRPFFLFGAITAAAAVPVWLAMQLHGFQPAGPFDALRWHAHEMIFGYLAAIIAGFILTAVPNWTGRFPLSGLPLAMLVGLWLVGRVASIAVSSGMWALVLDGAFLVVLAGAVWREIAAGGNLRNMPIAALVSLFAAANILFHLEGWGLVPYGLGERLALGAAAVMIALIGGRIVPSFTRNWMARLALEPLPAPFGAFDKVVLVLGALAVVGWIVRPGAAWVGALLLAAGILHLVRLVRWRGLASIREPIVLILHVGYFWLAASFVLMGLAALVPAAVQASTALHALSAGAVGTMTLAVMTRASLGHTGRAIVAGPATLLAYGLVTCGALLRVAAPWLGDWYLAALALGAIMWSGAFAVFVLAYAALLVRPGAGRI